MLRSKAVVAACGIGLSVALAACGSSGNTNAGQTGNTGSTTGSTAAAGAKSNKDIKIVTVVKLRGVNWFDRMETGVKEYAKTTGIDATQQGADDASPEKQVKIIQDLIAQKPTAITVVPNSPESLEGVLKQAMDAGIIVVTHEASNQKNTNVDIEAFNNAAYGAHMMDNLAQCMGGSGKYAAFVGHLTAKSHMEWVAGALAQAKSKYPNVQRIGEPIEAIEDANVAYQKTKELLAKYPDIKGFEGSAATDVAGIGRAIQEAGLQDKVCVMGTSLPSIVEKYLPDGSVDKIFFWDPAIAGQAMDTIATMLAKGEKVGEGTDLKLKGYENLKPIAGSPHGLAGEAWVDVDKTNASQYPF